MDACDGTPIGRRVFLGLAAFGVSGIVWGSKAADLMERLLGPIAVKDGSGLLGLLPTGRFRIYSVTGQLPNRAAGRLAARRRRPRRRPVHASATTSSWRCRPSS